jgi:hypothetical protein
MVDCGSWVDVNVVEEGGEKNPKREGDKREMFLHGGRCDNWGSLGDE